MTTTPTADTSTFLGSNPGLDRLYDNVMAVVPAVGFTLVKMMAWNTIEEFYLRSTAKRETVYWEMAIGVSSVDFNPFDATWLVAWILEYTDLFRARIVMPGLLIDTQQPATLRKGSALLALKPVSFSTNLPLELFEQWFETILDGTLFRLYATPAKPYSSPQLAAYHGGRYRGGVSRARAIAQGGYTDGGRWSFPQAQGFALGKRKN